MRRGSIASLIGIGVVAGGIAAAVALALPWLPKPASAEADRIDPLFWFVIVICIVVFAVVIAVILYSIVRFRAAPDDDSDGPPVHGHTGLEIVWTLIPTVLVTAIGIVSAIVLARNDAQGANVLHVNVTAQQFAWTFSNRFFSLQYQLLKFLWESSHRLAHHTHEIGYDRIRKAHILRFLVNILRGKVILDHKYGEISYDFRGRSDFHDIPQHLVHCLVHFLDLV